MIPNFILKGIIPIIKKIFFEMFDHQASVYKLKNTLDYMELPNDADRGVSRLQDEVNILKGVIKDMAKDIHPPAIDLKEWEEAKDILRKVKNMKKFKIG